MTTDGMEAEVSTTEDTLAIQGNEQPVAVPDTEAPEWLYDENIPGQGPKPDWFNDAKYKTLSEQAKAHPELRKLLGGFTGAPETYELSLEPQFNEITIDAENPLYKTVQGWAKDNNMSQDAFNSLVNSYVAAETDSQNAENEHSVAEKKAEIAKLGDNAQNLLTELNQWGQNSLPPELYPAFKEMAFNADAIKVFEYLKSKSHFSSVPTGRTNSNDGISRSELREMMNDRRYGRDSQYTKEIDNLYQKILG
jgi:hypothetical protein